MTRDSNVDVLVVTALEMEHDAFRDVALAVHDSAIGVKSWEKIGQDTSEPYLQGEYTSATGRGLKIALARPTRMGGIHTGHIAATLSERLSPRCLAMCGVCAGNPNYVALGDVIIADIAYSHEEGKRSPAGFEADYRQIPLDGRWVRAAQDMRTHALPSYGPPTERDAIFWILECLYRQVNPVKHPAKDSYLKPGEWKSRIEALEAGGLVRRTGEDYRITENGTNKIKKSLAVEVDPPERLPFEVRVGPIASGSVVVKDGVTWDHLRRSGVRTCFGLEMEAATIATTAHLKSRPWVVAKGVMDHADPNKNDRYKAFAARASAEVLLRFLSNNMIISASTSRPRIVRSRLSTAGQIQNPSSHDVLAAIAKGSLNIAGGGPGGLSYGDIETGLRVANHTTELRDAVIDSANASDYGLQATLHEASRISRLKKELIELYKIVVFRILAVDKNGAGGIPPFELTTIETFFGSLEPKIHNLFTEVSFSDALWNDLVLRHNPPGSWENHLHFSNALIADAITDDFRNRIARRKVRSSALTIRLLEIGTGGCNTSTSVLKGLLDCDLDNVSLEYLGIDINPSFADTGNKIITELAQANRSEAEGPGWSLRPWPNHTRFVERGNAADAVNRICISEAFGTVDYAFTSYMLHHIPNGDALLTYLFGPSVPGGIHTTLGDPRQSIDYFAARLRFYLTRENEEKSPLEIFTQKGSRNDLIADYLAFSFSRFLRLGGSITRDLDRKVVIDRTIEAMQLARIGKAPDDPINQPWIRTFFFDPQRAMLQQIRDLAKEGGLVVIADPDGRSLFNRIEMANDTMKAVEMAVAHFRSLGRIRDILRSPDIGLDVYNFGRVIKTTRGEFELIQGEKKFMLNTPDIIDNNIGYFLAARKPIRSNYLRQR